MRATGQRADTGRSTNPRLSKMGTSGAISCKPGGYSPQSEVLSGVDGASEREELMGLKLCETSARLLALAASLSSAAAWAQPRTAAAYSTATSTTAPEPMANTAAPTSESEECIPTCRKSFICVKGQCVSRCNPPCSANEVCNDAAECVANAPAPPLRPQYAPAVGPIEPGTERMDLETEPPARAVPREAQIKTFAFVPRIGVQLLGSGSVEGQCSGSLCATGSDSIDYDLSNAVAISFDFLFKVGDLLRLGPGLTYTHTMDWQPSEGSSHTEMGNLTDLNFVLELIPRVSPTVWLVPRLQLGLTAFNASGTAETSERTSKADCSSSSTSPSGCDSIESPHLGFNIGAGFGVLFATGSAVRVRIDMLADYYKFNLFDVTETSSSGTAHMTATASGVRYLLLAGIEI